VTAAGPHLVFDAGHALLGVFDDEQAAHAYAHAAARSPGVRLPVEAENRADRTSRFVTPDECRAVRWIALPRTQLIPDPCPAPAPALGGATRSGRPAASSGPRAVVGIPAGAAAVGVPAGVGAGGCDVVPLRQAIPAGAAGPSRAGEAGWGETGCGR
jgi:hypothetical protein